VNRQCTPQSLATFQQPLRLTGAVDSIRNITFILVAGWGPSPFPHFCEKAVAKGWKTVHMQCGHDVMLDLPEDLTRELAAIAVQRAASA
jgi:hypothetical protein